MQNLFPEGVADYPRPEGRALRLADLAPADVLLSRGAGRISDNIVSADGGSYSHAALWSGSSIIEARQDGVRERALDSERDVYRFVAGLSPQVADQVVAFARAKVGQEYAFDELYLLGAIFALGLVPERSLLRGALELLGGAHADRLERWITGLAAGRMPVICTELVALAFYEADTSRAYALQVLPIEARPPRPGTAVPRPWAPFSSEEQDDVDVLSKRCRQLIGGAGERWPFGRPSHVSEESRGERKVLWGSVALRAGSDTKLAVVTPADLQFSPSLTFVGRVAPT